MMVIDNLNFPLKDTNILQLTMLMELAKSLWMWIQNEKKKLRFFILFMFHNIKVKQQIVMFLFSSKKKKNNTKDFSFYTWRMISLVLILSI